MKYAKKLEEMGIPKEQAEAQVQIIADIMEGTLASKYDVLVVRNEVREEIRLLRVEIAAVRAELKEEIAAVRNELKEEIAAVRTELKLEIVSFRTELKAEIDKLRADMLQLQNELTIRLGKMMAVMLTIAVSVFALIR